MGVQPGGDLDRVWSRLSDHENRLRSIESINPQRVAADLDKVEARVEAMDLHGTTVTQINIRNLADDIAEIKKAQNDAEVARREDARSQRNLIRSTLASAAVAVGIAVLNFILSRPG